MGSNSPMLQDVGSNSSMWQDVGSNSSMLQDVGSNSSMLQDVGSNPGRGLLSGQSSQIPGWIHHHFPTAAG